MIYALKISFIFCTPSYVGKELYIFRVDRNTKKPARALFKETDDA